MTTYWLRFSYRFGHTITGTSLQLPTPPGNPEDPLRGASGGPNGKPSGGPSVGASTSVHMYPGGGPCRLDTPLFGCDRKFPKPGGPGAPEIPVGPGAPERPDEPAKPPVASRLQTSVILLKQKMLPSLNEPKLLLAAFAPGPGRHSTGTPSYNK